MPLIVKDRVQQTSSTVGTGTLTLSGTVSGFQTFSSAIGNGNTTYYTIVNGAEWEVGLGTVAAGTLSRDTVLESSNGGSLVNFSAGTKAVFVTYPAEKSVTKLSDLTSGRVAYATTDGVLADSSNLVWDNTNARLGIGTTSPTRTLSVYNASSAFSSFQTSVSGTTSTDGLIVGADGSNAYVYNYENTPIIFGTNATERMRIDSAGNLGLGVTPSAWASSTVGTVMQVGDAATIHGGLQGSVGSFAQFLTNAYFNGTAYTYKNSNYASRYLQQNSVHSWQTAPSGTAGNAITFTQAMTLDASGNLGIGTTSPTGKLEVFGANGSGSTTLNVTGGASAGDYGVLGIRNGTTTRGRLVGDASVDAFRIDTAGGASTTITFLTGASYTERMRITSTGNVGIGVSNPSVGLVVAHGTDGIIGNYYSSSGTNSRISFSNVGLLNNNVSIGSASTAMVMYTNNTERMRIDASGNVGVGVTPSAWSGYKAIEFIGGTGLYNNNGNGVGINSNTYWNGSNWIYKNSYLASRYDQNDSIHKWFTAPSGTAGNAITFTQAMTLHASGGLSLGNTTDAGAGNLRVNGKIKTGGYTVATLPAGVVGDRAYVTDALAPTYLGVLVGGGAVTCPAFYNGTAWVSA